MIDGAVRLPVRPPAGGRGVGVVCGLVLVAFGAVFAAVGWTMARPDVVAVCPLAPGQLFFPASCVRPTHWYEFVTPAQLIALLGGPVVLAGAALTVSALRSGAWLSGRTLVVRGLWTRTADLATAAVIVRGRPTLHSSAVLDPPDRAQSLELVVSPARGRELRVALRAEPMPEEELRLLASAISGTGFAPE